MWPFSLGLPEITQGDASFLSYSGESTTGLELTPAVTVQRNIEDRLIANRTSSKTLRLLHDLKQKNDRLEQLLRNSLQDIKLLKERELHYQQQMQTYMREEQRSFQVPFFFFFFFWKAFLVSFHDSLSYFLWGLPATLINLAKCLESQCFRSCRPSDTKFYNAIRPFRRWWGGLGKSSAKGLRAAKCSPSA